MSPQRSELIPKAGHSDHILALYVESRGDFIVVGDLMKSLCLLVYREVDDTIEQIARDYNANWMSSVGILDDDTYIGAETHMNLFTVQKNSGANNEETRQILRVVGGFHLGEFVNRFHHGSLVMQETFPSDKSVEKSSFSPVAKVDDNAEMVNETIQTIVNSTPKPQLIFATINGVIGVIANLDEMQYNLLKNLEVALSEVIKGVGELSHSEWRSFRNERVTKPCTGFIDGDLIEGFLDLSPSDTQKVLDRFNELSSASSDDRTPKVLTGGGSNSLSDLSSFSIDLDTLTRFVECLSRIH
jgi:DNA damage-binding protein 1